MKITLRAARINAGLSADEVSKNIGICKTTLGNWERGKSSPAYDVALKLAELYSCPAEDIIFLKTN